MARMREYLETQRKKARKTGPTRGDGDSKAREARSKAIKRQQGRSPLLPSRQGYQTKMSLDA